MEGCARDRRGNFPSTGDSLGPSPGFRKERPGIGPLVGMDQQGGVMFRPARRKGPKAVR